VRVVMQSGDAAEVDHGERVDLGRVQRASQCAATTPVYDTLSAFRGAKTAKDDVLCRTNLQMLGTQCERSDEQVDLNIWRSSICCQVA